jgi:transcription antitermination factor NusG
LRFLKSSNTGNEGTAAMTVQGNMAAVRDALKNARPGDVVGVGEVNPLAAEIDRNVDVAWYAVEVMPGQERSTAAHLVGRRFGIYLPEMRHEPRLKFSAKLDRKIVERGKQLLSPQLMLPGYVLVFTWLTGRNLGRITATPGVFDFVRWRTSLEPAVLCDALIDGLRAVENILCPMAAIAAPRKDRKRWRRERLTGNHDSGEDIISVRCLSALRDLGEQDDVDGMLANQILRRALGLALRA